jgi:hypothetical protein
MKYFQCKLQKDNKFQTVWLPDWLAQKGKTVNLATLPDWYSHPVEHDFVIWKEEPFVYKEEDMDWVVLEVYDKLSSGYSI